MAERFGANPHVLGWQLDNEYNRFCYCPRCQRLFQQYLAQRYGTLDELNRRWTTAYWSQTYDAWEQIPLPIGPHNPGLMLEHKHFITESYRRFQRLQIDALRPHLPPDVWITHNFMYWHDGYDHYALSEDLDLASWDWYVGIGQHDYRTTGAAHDLVRGYKRQNFWLMETQPGNVNWKPLNNVVDKGEHAPDGLARRRSRRRCRAVLAVALAAGRAGAVPRHAAGHHRAAAALLRRSRSRSGAISPPPRACWLAPAPPPKLPS